MLTQDVVCVVTGRVKRGDDAVSIFASDLRLPDLDDGPRGPVMIHMAMNPTTDAVVGKLRNVLSDHPGPTEVQIHLTQPGRRVVMRVEDSLRVEASNSLFGDLKQLLGPNCLPAG